MRVVFACVVLGLWVTLTGCATTQLFNPETTYEEQARELRISDDDLRLVLVGEDYHYLLDVPESLRPIFHASYQPLIQWRFESMEVLKDQTVTLKYYGSLDGRLASQEDKDAAVMNGFMADKNGKVYISGSLSGRREDEIVLPPTRILAWSGQPRNPSSRIGVTEERTTTKRVFLMAMTPVALVLDGAVVVTVVPYVASIFGVGNFWRALGRVIGASVANSGFVILTGGHPPRFQ
ncbi:hypothetical protein [Hylemonella gracilis]|uniref:Lipoprotein n=1 Tax=Hylemonella gracilis ATCC 19624 TaxID=887062 RepID=F3KSZ9_9BURK|nr:hypothetical protein [Hylemonella gracilis]EGI77218.1 hypothetical protein HGR_07891 [Hylemonella gracilis ATCC 19624]